MMRDGIGWNGPRVKEKIPKRVRNDTDWAVPKNNCHPEFISGSIGGTASTRKRFRNKFGMTEEWFTYRKTFNSMMWTENVGMDGP